MASTHASEDHAEAFDGEPIRELAPDEPKTPAYIPAIGLSLLLVASVVFLARARTEPPQPEPSAPPPAAHAPTVIGSAMAPQPPAAPSAAAPRQLTDEDRKRLQDRIKELAGRDGGAPRPPVAPARPKGPPR